jgi:hypothetical protein
VDYNRAIKSFSECVSFLCAHCEARCETPACKTITEAQDAIKFLKGAKNTEQLLQPDTISFPTSGS